MLQSEYGKPVLFQGHIYMCKIFGKIFLFVGLILAHAGSLNSTEGTSPAPAPAPEVTPAPAPAPAPEVTPAQAPVSTPTPAPAPAPAPEVTPASAPAPASSPAPATTVNKGTPESFESLKGQFLRQKKQLEEFEQYTEAQLEEKAGSNWWANLIKLSKLDTKNSLNALWTEAEVALEGGSAVARVDWWSKIAELSKEVDGEFAVAQSNSQVFNLGRLKDLKARVSNVKQNCDKVFKDVIRSLERIPLNIKLEIEEIINLFNELRNQSTGQTEAQAVVRSDNAAMNQIATENRRQSISQSSAPARPVAQTRGSAAPARATSSASRPARRVG